MQQKGICYKFFYCHFLINTNRYIIFNAIFSPYIKEMVCAWYLYKAAFM